MCYEQQSAEDSKCGTEKLAQLRPSAIAQYRPEHDDNRHEVLKDGGSCSIAGLDGGKISILYAKHADECKGNELHAVIAAFPNAEDISEMRHAIE